MLKTVFALASSLLLTAPAWAALNLQIDSFTDTEFSFTVSGTLEKTDNAPTLPGVFAVSPSEFVDVAFYTGAPTRTSNTLTIDGTPASSTMLEDGSTTGYSANFYTNTNSIADGVTVTGSMTFTGTFNTAAADIADFQLWLGYDGSRDLHELQASSAPAVPEPSTYGLIAGGLVAAFAFLRRRR
ncbi:MAG: hypothetical protein E1N59_3371 [Puniceicoccaceae bacterium 5H]|nr:MAG: hypothetical protein E1N59_3371 [Puniceicoccaceae bacterium 5H]